MSRLLTELQGFAVQVREVLAPLHVILKLHFFSESDFILYYLQKKRSFLR